MIAPIKILLSLIKGKEVPANEIVKVLDKYKNIKSNQNKYWMSFLKKINKELPKDNQIRISQELINKFSKNYIIIKKKSNEKSNH
jgi:hypothetical protein